MARKKGLAVVDENGESKPAESKEDRFVRLAIRRVPRAIKAIRAVRNLSSKATYAYSKEHAEKVCQAIADEVTDMISAFEGQRKSDEAFSL